jgi:hypothetical protein
MSQIIGFIVDEAWLFNKDIFDDIECTLPPPLDKQTKIIGVPKAGAILDDASWQLQGGKDIISFSPKKAKDKTVKHGMRLFWMPEREGILEARHRAPAQNREYGIVGHAAESTSIREAAGLTKIVMY